MRRLIKTRKSATEQGHILRKCEPGPSSFEQFNCVSKRPPEVLFRNRVASRVKADKGREPVSYGPERIII